MTGNIPQEIGNMNSLEYMVLGETTTFFFCAIKDQFIFAKLKQYSLPLSR